MAQASVVLFWFSLALYIAATVLYAYQFVLKRSKVGWWARFLTGAGFICQTLSIGAHSIATNGTQLTGPNQLMLASWALVLLYFVMEHLIKIKIYGAFLDSGRGACSWAPRRSWAASWSRPSSTEVQAMQLDSWRVTLPRGAHRVRQRRLRLRCGLLGASTCSRRASSRATSPTSSRDACRRSPRCRSIARRAISFAFPVYTAGLLLGILRAVEIDVSRLVARPAHHDVRLRVAGLRHLPRAGLPPERLEPHRRRGSPLCGFVLVVIVAIVARTVPVGFHVFGR